MKVKILAPSNLNEITVGQYQEFITIKNPSEKDVLKVFLGLSDRVLNRMSQKHIFEVSEQVMTAIGKEKPKFQQRFTLNDKEYGFIPDLDAITSGEYDDATQYMPTSETDEEGNIVKLHYDNAHRFMAVMFRPVIRTNKRNQYLIEDYQGSETYANVMKDAPLGVLLGCFDFFFRLLSELLTAIPNFIQAQVKQMESGLVKSGADTTDTMNSLRATLDELKKLQNIPYTIAS